LRPPREGLSRRTHAPSRRDPRAAWNRNPIPHVGRPDMELKSADATTAESMQDLLEMYEGILRIRRFEEEAFRLALEGKFSNYHAGLGQEAIPVGLCYG